MTNPWKEAEEWLESTMSEAVALDEAIAMLDKLIEWRKKQLEQPKVPVSKSQVRRLAATETPERQQDVLLLQQQAIIELRLELKAVEEVSNYRWKLLQAIRNAPRLEPAASLKHGVPYMESCKNGNYIEWRPEWDEQ